MFQPEIFIICFKGLEPSYNDAGQFYCSMTDAVSDDLSVSSEASVPLIFPRHQVQDIDTVEDWKLAELMFMAWTALGGTDTD